MGGQQDDGLTRARKAVQTPIAAAGQAKQLPIAVREHGRMGSVMPPGARRERAVQFWAHALSGSSDPACELLMKAPQSEEDGAGATETTEQLEEAPPSTPETRARTDKLLAVSARQDRVLLSETGIVQMQDVKRMRVHLDSDVLETLIGVNASEAG
ncbi:Hypothetical Protein FCC1311_013182 [Hondaea fermentalgiana]|uniref:Uncharacterized protein n=1 Tax=Hondaea fermentalgiana TaxID=2315210 RepID=A0A2R5GAI8_9STRA|nr:Hypothetical Protein FCC1311_013182 [Hondaea fermentalgiana]|eukprot:GBG25101.1 Hypothetical Protein FCC1311_013182 [Hondaea fermentalgiana]